jgi:indole-3-glycerol phosphate synthase
MNRLTEIIAHKRIEIEPLIEYTESWQERAQKLASFRGFKKSLSADSFGFIAEVKKASPSAGVIAENFDPVKIALAYDMAGANCVGINNRNLATFQVDLRTTEKLAPLIPTDRLVISESGIRSVEDVRRVAGAGVRGALIGESLMRAQNPQAVLESFRAVAGRF